jgi:hypothetical protein
MIKKYSKEWFKKEDELQTKTNYKTTYMQDLEKQSTSKEDMQFKFATSMWEKQHNKLYKGDPKHTKEIMFMVTQLTELMRTA